MSRTSLPPVRHQTRGAEPSPRINEDDEDLAGKIMGSQVPAERVLSSVLREEFAHPEQQRNWLAMTVAATNPDHPAHDFFIQRRERMRTHLSSGRLATTHDSEELSADDKVIPVMPMMDGLRIQALLDPARQTLPFARDVHAPDRHGQEVLTCRVPDYDTIRVGLNKFFACERTPAVASEIAPNDAVVVAYRRTAFGRAQKGSFAGERPEDLALTAVRAVLASMPPADPATFDDFYLGTALPEGAQGDNAARRVAVYAGYDSLPGATINRFCASSLQAIAGAARAIRAEDGDAFLVGGMESTSTTPPNSTNIYPGSEVSARRVDAIFAADEDWNDPRSEGLTPDVYVSMGKTAELVARLTGTTRHEQDEWALHSQARAAAAIDAGFFDREIAPHTRRDGSSVSADDGPRRGTTMEGLAALRPVFREGGTVTAGNASPLNDGASAAVLMSASRASELGLTPLARILGSAATAISPEIMGLGPITATQKLLSRLELSIGDIDLIELNEAFAAQVVPVVRQLGLDPERVNVNGGAIAIGHPFGATGTRLVGTLINALHDRGGRLGLATLCVGGGQGMALVLERLA